MRSFRLGTVRRCVLTLVGMLMFGMLAVPAAQANEPNEPLQWKYEGKVLNANETREITAKIPAGVVELEGITAKKLKVNCKEGKLAEGALIVNRNKQANIESNPEFSNCKVTGNGEKCTKVAEPIRLKTVRVEPVLNDLEPGVGTKISWEFDPREGSEFTELKFEPLAGNESCKFKNTLVTGLVLASLWTDKTTSGEEKEIEYGETREEASYTIKWPDEPKSVYTWEKSYKLFEPTSLDAFSEKAALRGELLILTVSGKPFGLVVSGPPAEPTEPLQWKYEGKVLNANETREITAKIPAGVLELEGVTIKKLKVRCSEGKLAKGAFIANRNEQAITESTPEFNKCEVEGNGEKCKKVEEPLRFKTLRAEPVLNDLEPGVGAKILWELDPRAGTEWAELKFESLSGNEECKFKNSQVTGLVLASAWTDKAVASGEEEELEYGETREETSYVLKWPDEPKSVWLWGETNYKLFEPQPLVAFSEIFGLRGELLILTAENGKSNGKRFGLAPR